jgi:CRP-like cAMP-binding protein
MDVVASLDIADRILALQAIPMFSVVDVMDLEQIGELVVECRYGPNEVVFRRGDLEDDMIMIVSGDVTLTSDVPVASRGPGQYIGELAMLRHSVRTLTAVAGPEGMHGMVMNCRLLEGLMEARPQIATAMLRSLADMLASAEH